MDHYPDHMSLVTSRSHKNERVRETYKYVIANLAREDAVCPTVPLERPSCKPCLKLSQLLACTTLTLPGPVPVGRCLSPYDFCVD